ncbi:2-keto-3-deoxygluconate permease [Pantoea agglomerans]|uniref:2-keto-3-deoxygluconate permease n=1 Tax=Enterobacter agglomerans TaxID=549 RepID=A0A379AGF0_ENTAG|nr:2-keto-3-deoxygluconate permease [Pantoea agglomerans]
MHIKRAIDKIPGGMMLIPLFIGALCHTFFSRRRKIFRFFHQRPDDRHGAHSGRLVFLYGRVD